MWSVDEQDAIASIYIVDIFAHVDTFGEIQRKLNNCNIIDAVMYFNITYTSSDMTG